MIAANGGPDRSGQSMVVVCVADEVNQALTGHPGARYESPPQDRQQALALGEVLLPYTRAPLDGPERWSCPIAGGRRTITLVCAEVADVLAIDLRPTGSAR